MGIAFCLMWSSAFTSARIIVEHAPPLTSLAIRFLISGLLGVAIAFAIGERMRLSRAQWVNVLVFGICQNALYLGFNFMAMQWVEASFAAIVASVMPLLVAFAGWVVFHERPATIAIAGLIVGFVGVAIIMGSRLQGGVDLTGALFCVIGLVALTVATLAVRGASSGGNILMIVGLQMLVGAAALIGPALALEPWEVDWTPSLGWAFAYTTIVPGLLATWVWFQLVGRIGMVKAATFHFLNPFFGVVIAAWLLSEGVTTLDMVGVAVIAVGILCVQLGKQAPKPA